MPSNTPSSVSSHRTRTPSELKWLRNERAALLGRLENQRRAAETQRQSVAAAEAVVEERRAQLAVLENFAAETEATILALERTAVLAYPDVPPAAAVAVKAHVRFGQRGALIAFLLRAVTDAGDAGLSTARLTELTRKAFGVPASSKSERESLRFTVRNRLRELRDLHGLVLDVKGPMSNSHSTWRLRPQTTLSDLHRLAAAAEAESADECDPHPHSL